jgi:hypothetical protein
MSDMGELTSKQPLSVKLEALQSVMSVQPKMSDDRGTSILPAALRAAEAAWSDQAIAFSKTDQVVSGEKYGVESCCVEITDPSAERHKDHVQKESREQSGAAVATCPATPTSTTPSALQEDPSLLAFERNAWQALQAAWLPFAFGWKQAWWDSVAVPEDMDDEEIFRWQLRCVSY